MSFDYRIVKPRPGVSVKELLSWDVGGEEDGRGAEQGPTVPFSEPELRAVVSAALGAFPGASFVSMDEGWGEDRGGDGDKVEGQVLQDVEEPRGPLIDVMAAEIGMSLTYSARDPRGEFELMWNVARAIASVVPGSIVIDPQAESAVDFGRGLKPAWKRFEKCLRSI